MKYLEISAESCLDRLAVLYRKTMKLPDTVDYEDDEEDYFDEEDEDEDEDEEEEA